MKKGCGNTFRYGYDIAICGKKYKKPFGVLLCEKCRIDTPKTRDFVVEDLLDKDQLKKLAKWKKV